MNITTTPNVSDILRDEIEKIKLHIKETDINLRKYSNNIDSGNRNPFGLPIAQNQGGRIWHERGVSNLNVDRRRPDRPLKRPFDEEQYQEELPNKPSVLSLVGTAKGDAMSREDVLMRQSNDKESKGRNQRMFGLLLGTLQQFKVEEKGKTDQLEKRKLVEQKVQVKEREEKHKLQRMKGDMITDKKSQQAKLRRLMNKMEMVKLHEAWENQCSSLQYFIRTSSKPNIFYLPKTHTEQSQKKLQQSKKTLLGAIEKRRTQLGDDIKKLLDADFGSDNDNQDVSNAKTDNKDNDNRSNNNVNNWSNNSKKIHRDNKVEDNRDDRRNSDNRRDNRSNRHDKHRRNDKDDRKENEITKRKINDYHKSGHHRSNNKISDEPHSDLDEDAPQHQVAIDYEGPVAMESKESEIQDFQNESVELPLNEIKLPETENEELLDKMEVESGKFSNIEDTDIKRIDDDNFQNDIAAEDDQSGDIEGPEDLSQTHRDDLKSE